MGQTGIAPAAPGARRRVRRASRSHSNLERGPSGWWRPCWALLKAGGRLFPARPADPEPRLRVLLQGDASPAAVLVIGRSEPRGRVRGPGRNIRLLDGAMEAKAARPPAPIARSNPAWPASCTTVGLDRACPSGVEVAHRGIVRASSTTSTTSRLMGERECCSRRRQPTVRRFQLSNVGGAHL